MEPKAIRILEQAAMGFVPIFSLVSPFRHPRTGEILPRWDLQDAVRTFGEAFDRGDLEAHWLELPEWKTSEPFVPDREALSGFLSSRGNFFRSVYYGLTAAGGARWETLSQARWEHYIRVDYNDDSVEIFGSSRERVEEYVRLHNDCFASEIGLAEGQWHDLLPWPVTHWKTLSAGYRLVAPFRELELPSGDPRGSRQRIDAFRDRDRWYLSWSDLAVAS
jgi:hypothetical protein